MVVLLNSSAYFNLPTAYFNLPTIEVALDVLLLQAMLQKVLLAFDMCVNVSVGELSAYSTGQSCLSQSPHLMISRDHDNSADSSFLHMAPCFSIIRK